MPRSAGVASARSARRGRQASGGDCGPYREREQQRRRRHSHLAVARVRMTVDLEGALLHAVGQHEAQLVDAHARTVAAQGQQRLVRRQVERAGCRCRWLCARARQPQIEHDQVRGHGGGAQAREVTAQQRRERIRRLHAHTAQLAQRRLAAVDEHGPDVDRADPVAVERGERG